MDYRRNEIKAGVFLLLAFTIMVVMIFAVSDVMSLFRNKKDIKVLFLASDGIEKNAPVRLSGLKVGKVVNVRIAPEQGDKIELTLSVFSDTVIKRDTKASIKTQGLIGGKYVELNGGSANSPAVEPDGMIIGEESFKVDDLTKMALDVVAKLKHIADNIDTMIGDPALAKSLKTTIANLQDVSSNIKDMTSNKEEVAQSLKNLPEILKKLDASAESLKDITAKSDTIVTENKKNIDAAMVSFKEIAQNLKETTDDVKGHPWKLLRKP